MWHEARKQEKMIRGMIVDYRRRAERRKDFYEKIKADPTQFLQLHGRPCKIHLDPTVAAAGEGPAIMMPWQGDTNNMIDRFDVRAHLDYIPDIRAPDVPPEDLSPEERQCNYERYRILAQNGFLGMSEDKFLQQLAIEEQFGVTLEEKEMAKEKLNEKKGTGVAIGYNYSDPTAQPSTSIGPEKKVETKDSDDDSDLEILDVDLSIDVNKMEASQAHELNAVGPQFGMAGCDLFSFLTGDADDAEHQKQLLREEKEKAMFSGRKSRRERRAHRDKKLATRVVSPPSYAARPAPPRVPAAPLSPPSPARSPPSPARTASPDPGGDIEFITSFGGDDDEVQPPLPSSKPLYSEKVKQNLKKMALYSEIARKTKARSPVGEMNYSRPIGPRGPDSRSVSRSRSKSISRSRSVSRERSQSRSKSRSRSRSYVKSRSRSRSHRKSRSKSRSSSRSRSRSRSRSFDSYRRRSRSRSRSRNYRGKRSRSISNTTSAKRNKSRSMSFERSRGACKPAVPRYYGRRKEDKSSSELSLDSESTDSEDTKNKSTSVNKSNSNPNQLRSSGSSSKAPRVTRVTRETVSLKEKLKRKMQAQLSRQLRADKRAEALRLERERGRQARRDEEMRDLAIKLRRKQREMRHKYRRSSDESDRSRSGSSSRESAAGERKSQSRSPSPQDKLESHERPDRPERPPVWETKDFPPRPEERDQMETQRSRSRSPDKRYPVWEHREGNPHHNPPPPYRQDNSGPSYPEFRKYDEERPYYRNENPRYQGRSNEHFEQNQYNRWDGSRRRPYGHRGGYRGYARPDVGSGSQGPPSHWKDDRDDGNRGKVKLVDY